jgi:hypothetical protein
MRVLGSIIQISALPMLDAREQLSLSDTIAPQLIGHDHPRFILQTLQQPFEEALRRSRREGGIVILSLNKLEEPFFHAVERWP